MRSVLLVENFMFLKRLFLSALCAATFVFAQETVDAAPQVPVQPPSEAAIISPANKGATVSVFIKSPEEIQAFKDELKNLQTMAGDSNPAIAALLQKANRIAELNDRCASISLNDLLDTTCGRFYEVELPAFENEYMELTGEIRLGSMRMATSLDERIRQLTSCSDAIATIVISRDQLLRLHGNVYLEPINYSGDFDAEYDFSLSYDPTRVEQQLRLANLWIQKCGPIVLRQSGSDFAPMFVATMKMKNDSLKKAGSNLKFMMNRKSLSLRVDMRRPVSGAYYLNGNRLFEKTIEADKKYSNLVFDIKNKKAEWLQPKDAVIEEFKGKQVFKKLKKMEMIGRWTWDSEKLPDAIDHNQTQDESEVMTAEDSLAYKQGLAELNQTDDLFDNEDKAKQAATDAQKSGNSIKIHWVPLAISGAVAVAGGVMAAVFNSKAKSERDVVPANKNEYNEQHDKIEKNQRNRNISLGIMAAGLVGVGVTFLF